MGIKWSGIFIGLILTIAIIPLISCSTHAIISEESRMESAKLSTNYTTVADILVNPEKYNGKLYTLEDGLHRFDSLTLVIARILIFYWAINQEKPYLLSALEFYQ